MSYHQDVEINRNALDEEWEHYPSTYLLWMERAIEADILKAHLEDQLEVMEAQLGKEIRENPLAFGISGKTTEKAIADTVICHTRYREVKLAYLDSLKQAKLLNAAVKAMDRKEKSLEWTSSLIFKGYNRQDSFCGNNKIMEMITRQSEDTQNEILGNNPRLRRLKEDKQKE